MGLSEEDIERRIHSCFVYNLGLEKWGDSFHEDEFLIRGMPQSVPIPLTNAISRPKISLPKRAQMMSGRSRFNMLSSMESISRHELLGNEWDGWDEREELERVAFINLKNCLRSNIFDKYVNLQDPAVMAFFERFMKDLASGHKSPSAYRKYILRTLIRKNPKMLVSRRISPIYEYIRRVMSNPETHDAKEFAEFMAPLDSFRSPSDRLVDAFDDLSFVFQKNNKRKHDADAEESPYQKFARHSEQIWNSYKI